MRVIFETKRYKAVILKETKQTRIEYVQNKENPQMDKIRFVKLGNEFSEPQVICMYWHEDKDFIKDTLKLYGYTE